MTGIDAGAIDALVESLGDDDEGVRKVAGMFRANALALRDDILAALERDEPVAAAHAAHSLRGTAGLFGATALCRLTARLEKAGDAGRTDECVALLPLLAAEVDAVVHDLDGWLTSAPSNQR